MMGTISRVTGTIRLPKAEAREMPVSGSMASAKPIIRLPESPMKMRAGGRLNTRKPTIAPNSEKARMAVGNCPWMRAISPIEKAAKAPIPPARPSIPSIRLSALLMPTIQRMVSG